MDEIMHTCPWFHATNIPNCPRRIWCRSASADGRCRAGVKKGRERGSTVLTIQDIERIGIDKTIEIALEVAWKGASAVYSLSMSIDRRRIRPGTGWPEPAGFCRARRCKSCAAWRRKAWRRWRPWRFRTLRHFRHHGAVAVRAMVDVLASMVKHDRIGGSSLIAVFLLATDLRPHDPAWPDAVRVRAVRNDCARS